MFGVKKEQLVKGLCRLSCQLCAYIGPRCDCKYMDDSDEFIATGSEVGSGCPETQMAAEIINAMTIQEFYALTKRAGIQVSVPEEPKVEIEELRKKFQDQRAERMLKGAEQFAEIRAARKTARLAKVVLKNKATK